MLRPSAGELQSGTDRAQLLGRELAGPAAMGRKVVGISRGWENMTGATIAAYAFDSIEQAREFSAGG
jgi:hypothetical protein